MVPIELCMQRCRFQSNAVVPIKSVKRVSAIGVSMRRCRLDRHEQVPISMQKLCGGADQMCECQPLVFELPLGFGHQAGLQDGGACFEGAWWSRSIGHRGGADQFVNVAWVTVAVPISMERAGAKLMRARGRFQSNAVAPINL